MTTSLRPTIRAQNRTIDGLSIRASASQSGAMRSCHHGRWASLRIRSLVVGTGGAAYPLQLGDPLKEWVEAPDIEKYRRIDGRQVVTVAMSTLERYTPSEAAREDYLASYASERFFQSMAYARTYPTQLAELRELLPTIRTPVQIISGNHDRVVPPVNSQYLHERLPNSKLDIIDAGLPPPKEPAA